MRHMMKGGRVGLLMRIRYVSFLSFLFLFIFGCTGHGARAGLFFVNPAAGEIYNENDKLIELGVFFLVTRCY